MDSVQVLDIQEITEVLTCIIAVHVTVIYPVKSCIFSRVLVNHVCVNSFVVFVKLGFS